MRRVLLIMIVGALTALTGCQTPKYHGMCSQLAQDAGYCDGPTKWS
jgi:hypothetical protein